jgi:hypothetical protein
MRLKSVALRDSFAGILPRLTAESGIDIGAVTHELHSHPAVTAAAMLAAVRVGSQATWLPHRSFKSFPHHIVLEMPSGEDSFQWRASWN